MLLLDTYFIGNIINFKHPPLNRLFQTDNSQGGIMIRMVLDISKNETQVFVACEIT